MMFSAARSTLILLMLAGAASGAERLRLADGWRFHLGDTAGGERPEFDATEWSAVRLPHDWSIGLPRSPDEPSAGGGGFFPTGVGWYRRELDTAASPDERCWIVFEGVYRNAEVWLDGERLGGNAYGYTPFAFEATEQLRKPGGHTLAVRVDNAAQPNSRWYSGSGIYRHVWLERRPLRSITPDACVVRVDELEGTRCQLTAAAEVTNASQQSFTGELRIEIVAPSGQVVATAAAPITVDAGRTELATQRLSITDCETWSPLHPAMHTVRWALHSESDQEAVDQHEQPLGIRTVSVDAEHGLRINGEPVVLYGGNVHHGNGCLGAAAFDAAEERKARLMKEAGFNAVRCAHNPPSAAFLDACDRLGLLVIDEAFDGWAAPKLEHDFHEHFAEQWPEVLRAMVLRDRRHPSVIMWSIGNEMFERGSPETPAQAQKMVAEVRRLDPTRPVTVGVNGLGPKDWSRLDRLFAELDVAGYNYEHGRYADDHQRLPERVMFGSESYAKDLAATRRVCDPAYVIGDFVWSGIDYLGEAGIGQLFPQDKDPGPHWKGNHYPSHATLCGDIDLTGFRKPISHFRNIAWDRGERLFMAVVAPSPDGEPWGVDKWGVLPSVASWTWPGQENRELTLQVASRYPRVLLELNGRQVAEVDTGAADGDPVAVGVAYQPGELVAIGLDAAGAQRERFALTTAGPAAEVRLRGGPSTLAANGQDLCFVEVEVVDADGRLRADSATPVHYTIEGPGELIGIGSADATSQDPYNASPRPVYRGRALAVVRSTHQPGEIRLTARADGLPESVLLISSN